MSTATPRLLIVDDRADARDMLSRRLKRRGFDVVEAADGAAALELIAREPFDLVMLDILMPGLSGTEVLRQIRADHSPSALPVIMVTAKAETDDVVEALKLGANDYVTKPVNLPVALARVQTQIARKQAEDELLRANDNLERFVADLVAANKRLETEIAERQQAEARLYHLMHHDALTGLANRLRFHQEIVRELARTDRQGGGMALICIDLDLFKTVNEAFGHGIGDALLQAISERLRGCLRATDLVARLGADEFAIIQTTVNKPEEASRLAERVMQTIATPFQIDGHDLTVRCSVGIAIGPGDDGDPDRLLRCAEMAVDRAKADGRNVCRFYEPEMNARAEERRLLEADLRNALAAGEFELFYQPLFNLAESAISGVEALLRWNHPERGRVSPAEFIPILEETGLIVPIGEWVLRQACAQAVSWPEDVKIAVNLSAVQFGQGLLVPAVVQALAASGLEPDRLELEITETVLLKDNEKTLALLHQLKALGVRISMDDFGTGYSSLSYLRSFPFDKLKIDQTFVRDLGSTTGSMAIVRAITSLADSLGITTTAEGVETHEQLERLRREGCTEVQGYLISRPLPAKAMSRLLSGLREQARRIA